MRTAWQQRNRCVTASYIDLLNAYCKCPLRTSVRCVLHMQGCSRFANISTAAATAAPNAASTSPAQDVHAELALLTSLLGRHLHQQQQAAAAATAAAAAAAPAEQQYSARSAPPAPDAADYEDSGYTESPVSAAAAAAAAATSRGGTSTPPVSAALAAVGGTPSNQGQRARRKNTDTMQKLQVGLWCIAAEQLQQCETRSGLSFRRMQ